MSECKLIVAIDTDNQTKIRSLFDQLESKVLWVKIGHQALNALGAGQNKFGNIKERYGYSTFLDLKFHDIPRTVARDVGMMTRHGAHMINMHAAGGTDMMKAAKESADQVVEELGIEQPLLLGLTVLTSMYFGIRNLIDLQINQIRKYDAIFRAEAVKEVGLDGVVAPVHAAKEIRSVCGSDFIIVTPGIRLEPIVTPEAEFFSPEQAAEAGADYIVMGSQIINDSDPSFVVDKVLDQLKGL